MASGTRWQGAYGTETVIGENIMSTFRSLQTSAESLDAYLVQTGYWSTEQRRERNKCVLSPCGFFLSGDDREKLDAMARDTHAALQQVSSDIYTAAQSKTQSRESQKLLSIVRRCSRGLCDAKSAEMDRIPDVIKVDLVRDIRGQFRIVEVDAYNPRGLGFNVLLDNMVKKCVSEGGSVKTFDTISHVACLLRGWMGRLKAIAFIQSDHERYYNPSFDLFYQALQSHGFFYEIIRESEFRVETARQILSRIDHNVFMIPESIENVEMRDFLMQQGAGNCFMPPKAFLGSKLLLPYLRSMRDMKKHIPETYHVSRYDNIPALDDCEFILKKGLSSGMRGVYFSSDVGFKDVLDGERGKKRPSYVLQKVVEQKPEFVDIYDENGNLTQGDYYFRYIAQFTRDGIIGLDITGRPDRAVHGAKDCIMVPTILV